jgi:predicted RNA-binding protein with TRAM domain
VVVSWSPPASDGGSPLTYYAVEANDSTNPSNGGGMDTNDGSATSATMSGLTPGDQYTFTVVAANALYSGTPSSDSAPVTIAGAVPGPPQNISATAGSAGSVTLSWQAPADSSVAAPTSYTVVAVDGTSAANGGQNVTVDGSASGATIAGLIGGDSYTFQVTATGDNGYGPAASSPAVTTWTLPTAPRFASGTANPDGSVTVDWTAPSQPGGKLTGYTITGVDETTSAALGTVASASGSATSAQVTGLTGGDSYEFQVKATNSHGSGPVSSLSPSVSPFSVAGAPTRVSAALNTDRSVTVSWTAPTSDGGSKLTQFVVTAIDSTTPANGGQTVTADSSATSATFTKLSAGDSYTFVVQAVNGVGSSAKSVVSNAVSIPHLTTVPGAPTGVSAAVNGDGSVTVSWTAPTSDGGSKLTQFVVTAIDLTTPGNGGQTVTAGPSATSGTFTTLSAGDSYTFVVQAVNGVGSSAKSAVSSSVSIPGVNTSAPGAPTGISATLNGDGSVTVSWTAPTSDGGSNITQFVATAVDSTTPANGGQTITSDSSTTSGTFTKLSAGDSYTFVVQAVNGVGSSANSAASNSVSIPGVNTSPGITSLAITKAPTTVVYGKTIAVTGTLKASGTGLGGQQVALLYRPLGSTGTFTRFPSPASTGPTGTVSFTTFKPTTPVQIELSFASAGAYAASTSSTVNVAETPTVSLRLSSKKVKPQKTVTFTGAVAPNDKGKEVQLQRQVGRRWVKVTTAKLTAASKYTLRVKTRAAGRVVYRVSIAAIGPFGSATSSTVRLIVT